MSAAEQKLHSLSASIAKVSQSIRAAGATKQKHLLKVRDLELSLQSAADGPEKEDAQSNLDEYKKEYDEKAQSSLKMTLLESTFPEGAVVTVSCSQPIEDYDLSESEAVAIMGIKKSLATLSVSVRSESGGAVVAEGDAMEVEPLCKAGVKAVEEITLPAPAAAVEGTEGEGGAEEKLDGGGSIKVAFEYSTGTADVMEELRVEYEGLEKERREVITVLRREKAEEMQQQGGAVKKGFLSGGGERKPDNSVMGKAKRAAARGMQVGMSVWRFKNILLFFGVVGMVGWKGDELALPEPV
ncbi:hypothetical protein TrRE_jg10653 [Triparma retinervis]|uniref:Uncharacterized protein n=1 Tax=Triparma retinervis TaxID=2557542 RepID=A0A9W6ZKE5_9STRA|nr:hypothetical protein TrRE_jg10653 [Triparma retinervis]